MLFHKFGEAINNSSELTTFINIIKLDLFFDKQIEKKNESSKINVLDIINNVEKNEKYKIPKRSINADNAKISSYISNTNTIKISNINSETTDTDLRMLFEEFGTIKRIYIPKEKKSQEYLGYAFLSYNERIEAENAINKMNKYAHKYCILNVAFAN